MNTSLNSTVYIDNELSYKVLGITQKKCWNDYIKRSLSYDFYHTWDYHVLDTAGSPLLFVYEQEGLFIALPLIKREINGSDYFDCTSAYGYTGPLSNVDFAEIPINTSTRFFLALEEYLLSIRIVSLFSVLHPLMNQFDFLKRKISLSKIGNTIGLDLRQSLEQQRLQYRRPVRQKINQLRRNGFIVKLADSAEQLLEFAAIYRENMTKVGASSRYFFDDKYFHDFINSQDYEAELLVAYYQNRMVAGALVTFGKTIMQLHLSATSNDFLRESPMKLIFDEASLLGRAKDMHILHLGSGIGGREDSLFHFKRGFSECLYDFATVRYIVDPQVYNNLVEAKIKNSEAPNTDLFPLYRFL